MKIISEQNIGRVSFFFTVIVVSVIIFAVGVFFVVQKYESASEELARVEQNLIEQEKIRLKADVDSFLLRIESLRDRAIARNDEKLEAESAGTEETIAGSGEPDWESVVDELQNAVDLSSAGYLIYHLHNPDGGERFATMLFNPVRPDLVGQMLSTDFPDARGFNFRKVFLKDIRDHGESFVMYHCTIDDAPDNTGASAIGRKLAYLKLYPEANWIVAKNSLLDQVDQFVVSGQAVLKSENRKNITILGLIFLAGILIALILAYLLSLGMQPLFAHYRAKEKETRVQNDSLKKMIEQQNRTDTLTSATNRSYFNQELVKEMARSERYKTPLSMILFDLDDFKSINDRLGCESGDTVLVELVELVRDNIRQTDILTRWGGEEFAILAPGIDLAHGKMFAEKLRLLIEDNRFTIDQRVACSFGVGFYDSSEDQHAFVQRIEGALRRAKAEGKNRCVAV